MMSSKLHVFILSSLLIFGCEVKKDNPDPPNIIYILVDDMGIGDLGCYGQTTLSTPNIDQLASEGMKFTNHYTGSTVCAPSRATLMTGLHTGHVSVRDNTSGQLLTEDNTVASLLKGAGYKTGIIGKWGIGHPPAPDDPMRNGFDYAYGYVNMWHAHNFYPEFLYRNGEKEMIPENKVFRGEDGKRLWADFLPEGAGVAEIKGQHVHELFEKEALMFIDRNKEDKFFLYLALNMPHANNEHPENGMEVPSVSRYEDKDWPEPEKGFATMIDMIDRTVGRVEQTIERLGLSDNTLIIFSSDNGPHEEGYHLMEYFNSNGDYQGMKRDLYEGGIRTPFIAKWPKVINAGSTSDHILAFWDFLPTACDLAETRIPDGLDGISFLPTLKGDDNRQEKHDYLYWEFYGFGGKQAVLKDGYKAIKLDTRSENPQPMEIYQLEKDQGENQNIARDKPSMVAEMQQIMDKSHTPLSSISLFKAEREIVNVDLP